MSLGTAAEPLEAQFVPAERLPAKVHVFEDYETEIEKRWWLRGQRDSNNVPPSLSLFRPNRWSCRAVESKDFDDKQGDAQRTYKTVVFNPVPGPPMSARTHLSFRYWLSGATELRIQIFSLTRNFHRTLTLTNLTPRAWQQVAVDLARARRPDGTGGPLSADERIDDIQFYAAAEAELLIDDILLYEPAPEQETRPFPRRAIFTGWFDTGQAGTNQAGINHEWPGDFELVRHEAPLTWKAAKSVAHPLTRQPWIRLHLRGARPLGATVRLRFRYYVTETAGLDVALASGARAVAKVVLSNLTSKRWTEATVDFRIEKDQETAEELRFTNTAGSDFQIDDVFLFEPGP